MFGLKKQQTLVEVPPTEAQVIPFPISNVPQRSADPEAQSSYQELATSLGFRPAALVREQLIAFFVENDIKLFDYDMVCAWLSHKKQEAGMPYWCWRPLREKDEIQNFAWGLNTWNKPAMDGYYAHGDDQCQPYDLLVPRHALEKVAKIEKVFGDDVKFFVSDYARPNPDPFIMVRPAGMERDGLLVQYLLVFDVWDEPGFGQAS